MLEEGRARVQDMRFGDSQSEDLALALATVGDALSKQRDIAFKLIRKGLPRMLSGPIRSEVYLIGREALLNAFRHSHAEAIEVEIAYDKKALVIRIYDDGAGIDESVLASGSKPGHWGLVGMHERATGIGGRLGIWARPGAGTQVQLSIPARVIYVDTRQARWKRFTRMVRRTR
jgi:signal transduction histidine kinase